MVLYGFHGFHGRIGVTLCVVTKCAMYSGNYVQFLAFLAVFLSPKIYWKLYSAYYDCHGAEKFGKKRSHRFAHFFIFIFIIGISICSRSNQCLPRLANDEFDILCLTFSPRRRVSFFVSHRDTAVDRNLKSFHMIPSPKTESHGFSLPCS